MKFIDRIKEDYNKVKGQPRKEKLEFFWEYYKIPILCIVLAAALLVQGIVALQNRKETVYSATMLNCKLVLDESGFLDGFYQYAGIDPATSCAAFYTDMSIIDGRTQDNATVLQRIMAGIAIQDTDFITGNPEAFHKCAYNTANMLMDLRNFFSAEELATFSDRLYYIDGAVMKQLNAPLGENVDSALITFPDPRKPDEMTDPIPVGIDITDRKMFCDVYYHDTYLTEKATVYLGFVPNSQRMDLNHKFVEYLFLPTAEETQ